MRKQSDNIDIYEHLQMYSQFIFLQNHIPIDCSHSKSKKTSTESASEKLLQKACQMQKKEP